MTQQDEELLARLDSLGRRINPASVPFKHGHTTHRWKSPTYRSWTSMRDRCLSVGDAQYHYYGGRGITICQRWDSFENFLEDMGERPLGLTLERKDTNGPYTKDNCTWATVEQQKLNMRTSKRWTIHGVTYNSQREAAIALGVAKETIARRTNAGIKGYSSAYLYEGGMK